MTESVQTSPDRILIPGRTLRSGLSRLWAWVPLLFALGPALLGPHADDAPPAASTSPATAPLACVAPFADLRPEFAGFGLGPDRQGSRGTCSAFTVTAGIEFALARKLGATPRLSVEFLNWAANRACGENEDGGFFSDLWAGYVAHGVCTAAAWPYRASFDPAAAPSPGAVADALTRRKAALRLHWIKPWDVRTGLTEAQGLELVRTLADGWPVCGGFRWPKEERWVDSVLEWCPPDAVRDGHSVLLVGYRVTSGQPGGGVFIFRNTAGAGHDRLMTFAYARDYMNDAAWISSDRANAPNPALNDSEVKAPPGARSAAGSN